MTRLSTKVLVLTGVLGIVTTGCIVTPTPTTPITGFYAGVINGTSTFVYSDGTPTKTVTTSTPTNLTYNSSSVLTQWTRILLDGTSIATINNPQAGTVSSYNTSVGGVNGVVTLTIQQVSYTSTLSTLTGTGTFASGSTGYSGSGTFTISIQQTTNGVNYVSNHVWTVTSPGGNVTINVQEQGSGFLPKN